ncbi:phage tail sheath subtilisin-like domain-containing protein [Vibrio scophthalmi]|uniref:Tail sheath protein n=1 Tax=Vibrio scophthalmi TaxID=45658 RepID=A0A1E3WMC1_9VIBR|nr:phage tail sheath subtilisin-like domain-containing protein [Vibrio scophthalmi]ODS10923.1 Tail sheath protein [Vibrio scophthalmi]
MNEIPNDIRVPLFYMEFDNSGAVTGTPAMVHRILAVGQLGTDATAQPFTHHRITQDEQARELFGDSMLTDMIYALRKANDYTELVAMGIADLTEGNAASCKGFTFAGTAQSGGTGYLMIGGKPVQFAIAQDDTSSQIATKAIAAINKMNTVRGRELRVAASSIQDDAASVMITAKHKGLTSNDIDLRINYYFGETLPKGVTCTVGQMANGSGMPDMVEIVSQMGTEWYNHIVMPYSDTASVNTLNQELLDRWGPLAMQEMFAYQAFRGTHGETGTHGSQRNHHLFTCMGTNMMPTPPWEVAAGYAGVAAYHLAIAPARPLQTLSIPGVLPPSKEQQWDMIERNLLLHDGIATYFVDAAGEVCIEREITTYQVNKFGSPDPSYLDLTTPATLGYFRYAMKVMITQRYPRHKLAGDDVLADLEPGQPVVTPSLLRDAFLEKYLELVGKGLVEDYATFEATLQVVRNKDDKNRADVYCHPNVINGLRILASQSAFIL